MNSLTERALNLTGWRQLAACLFAGGLASLTLPPFGLVPLALALSYPALCIARTGSTRRAAMIGCVTGFGWFLVSLWWISLSLVTGDINFWPLLPLPLLGIPLLLSLFWVPAAAINFAVIPLPSQVLYMSACGVFWNFFLSMASNAPPQPAAKAKAAAKDGKK